MSLKILLHEWLERCESGEAELVEVIDMTTRTTQQNKAYWKWLTLLAESLNDAGYSQNDKIVITCDVPFTKDNLHELCCKPYINQMWPEKTSSTQLSTIDEDDLYMVVDQAIASRTGCHVEWPSEESLSEDQRE